MSELTATPATAPLLPPLYNALEPLSPQRHAALRLRHGFSLADFTDRTGLPVTAIQSALAEAEAKGLITRDFQRVVPTERGFDFLSDLQSLFLSET